MCLFFRLNPAPFNKHDTKNKKDLELVTKEIEKKSFISYVLPDHV